MIQKSRVYPEFQYPPEKFQLDHFHNPYLAKLSLKLSPRPTSPGLHFLSPITGLNNLQASQVIPIYKDEKIRFALLWRQYLTSKFARAHFGISLEYKLYERLRVKTRLLAGTTAMVDLELAKSLPLELEAFFGYSGFAQTGSIYSTLSCGLRRGGVSALISHKIDAQTLGRLSFSKKVNPNLVVETTASGNLNDIEGGEILLGLSQSINQKYLARAAVVCTPLYSELALRVEGERTLGVHERLLVSTQWSEGRTIFYLGFRNLNFNISLPVATIDSPIPVIIALVAFAASMFLTKPTKPEAVEPQGKTQADRLEELRVISDKAADHYQKERNSRNGLLIEQAYIGTPQDIEALFNNPNRFEHLARNQEYRRKYVDLTVTMRFYVMKGELKLRKGDKNTLLGFYRTNPNQTKIGLRYKLGDATSTVFFDHQEALQLPVPQ